jgi:hypothetical protein
MAKISSGAYYENPPLPRWFLAPWPTYRVWRRMRMWNIQSYTDVILMEQESKVFRTTLRIRYGLGWRRHATKPEQLAIKLAKLGRPIGAALHEAHEQAAIEAPQGAIVDRHEGATEAPQAVAAERPESAMKPSIMAPQPVPQGAIESAPAPATEAPRMASRPAMHGATVDLVKRPQGATKADAMAPRERHEGDPQGAIGDALEAPPKRPAARPRSAPKAPRPAPSGRPAAAPRDAARDAIKALYSTRGRRPLESEMVAALKAAKLPHSRQFANARRLEIEREHPELAALGSDNVRPLTGTDG